MHAYQTLASMGELVKMRMVLLRANAKDIGRNLYAKSAHVQRRASLECQILLAMLKENASVLKATSWIPL